MLIESLVKETVELQGFRVLRVTGYKPLIRAYVGQGLRQDLDRLVIDAVVALISGL